MEGAGLEETVQIKTRKLVSCDEVLVPNARQSRRGSIADVIQTSVFALVQSGQRRCVARCVGRPTSKCFGDTVLVLFCQTKNEMQSRVAFDTFLLLPWAQLPCLQQQGEGVQICFTGLIQDSIKTVFPNGAVTSRPVPCAECPVGECRGLSMFLKLRCHSRVLVPPSCW